MYRLQRAAFLLGIFTRTGQRQAIGAQRDQLVVAEADCRFGSLEHFIPVQLFVDEIVIAASKGRQIIHGQIARVVAKVKARLLAGVWLDENTPFRAKDGGDQAIDRKVEAGADQRVVQAIGLKRFDAREARCQLWGHHRRFHYFELMDAPIGHRQADVGRVGRRRGVFQRGMAQRAFEAFIIQCQRAVFVGIDHDLRAGRQEHPAFLHIGPEIIGLGLQDGKGKQARYKCR